MRRLAKYAAVLALLLLLGLTGYAAKGFADALADAERLATRADALIAQERGAEALGPGRFAQLLLVQDPAFMDHSGVDFTTAGAGATTITQSLAKREGFEQFRPGIGKIRQTGYALGLERRLSKAQIAALWLDSVEIGAGPRGWMTGFYHASDALFGRPPAGLTDQEFQTLLAVLIAPGRYDLQNPDPALDDRIARIQALLAGDCQPTGHDDVWLEGCDATN